MSPASHRPSHRPTDHELDLSVADMLRFGVTLAALVVLIGGALSLRHPHAAAPDYTRFVPAGPSLQTIPGILQGCLHLQPEPLIQLGLVLLIATPVARVVFCVYGFARQRDKLYTLISLGVLVILFYSLTKGAH
jgi:uncharacterized membrane protein